MAEKKKIPPEFSSKLPDITITMVLKDFLDEQEKRLKPGTFSKYENVIELLSHSINSYAYGYLDSEEIELFNQFHEEEDMGFCDIFGPEHILSNADEFLDYFMPRKVWAGKDLMKTAGTVTKKLAKWLAKNGYIENEDAEDIVKEVSQSSKEQSVAIDLTDILHAYSRKSYYGNIQETLEDCFAIEKIERGKLWFSAVMSGDRIGPVPVPEEVSKKCKIDWTISLILGKTRKGWRIIEAGRIYP